MRLIKIIGIIFAVLLLVGAFLLPIRLIHSFETDGKFKSLAEQKAGEILRSKVSIGKVSLGSLNEISLRGLAVGEGGGGSKGYRVEVGSISFRYNWVDLIRRQTDNPAVIILKNASVKLGAGKFPFEFFESLQNSSGGRIPALNLEDGLIRVPLTFFKKELTIISLNASFQSTAKDEIHLHGRGVFEGVLTGKFSFVGEVNSRLRTYRINVHLADVQPSNEIPLPIDSVRGNLYLDNGIFQVKDLVTRVYGWDLQTSGEFTVTQEKMPKAAISWCIPGKAAGAEVKFQLQGTKLILQITEDHKTDFSATANLFYELDHLLLQDLTVMDSWMGQALLGYPDNKLQIHMELPGTPTRFDMSTDIKKLDTTLQIKLDHLNLSDMDLATDMTVQIRPNFVLKERKLWKLTGAFETNYFLIEFTPLDDFRGTFDVGTGGVQNFAAEWGRNFSIAGHGSLNNGHLHGAWNVQIKDYQLLNVDHFLSKPLPKKLGGLLNGTIEVNGSFPRPQVSGNLSIRDGLLGNLQYDLAMIQLAGVPPLIYLKDSKVYRGRTKLDLMGSINFSLPNILSDIQYQQPDNLIAFKAFQWESDEKEGNIDVALRKSKLPSLTIKAGAATGNSAELNEADKESHEKYIAVGPKIKF